MNETIYTQENWKLFLKRYFPNCKTKDEAYKLLSKELGIEASTINNSCKPSKELPTWAKGLIFAFIRSQNVTKELVVSEVIERIGNALNPMKSTEKTAVDLEIKI